jgi:Uma2 family endonuclease
MEALVLNFEEIGGLTDEEFYCLCISNKQVRIERNAKGEVEIMAPAGLESSSRNADISYFIQAWNRRKRLGKCFDSSGGFTLSNGAMRSPDVAFVLRGCWEALPKQERNRFAPLCPDFVVELMSESDALKPAQEKMHEWMENGCRLAWLIDPKREKTYIYRADGDISVVEGFDKTLLGEDVLPEFELNLAEIEWE